MASWENKPIKSNRETVICKFCGRMIGAENIESHEQYCLKRDPFGPGNPIVTAPLVCTNKEKGPGKKKEHAWKERKVFDMSKKRVPGAVIKSEDQPKDEKSNSDKKPTQWKEKSQNLREMIQKSKKGKKKNAEWKVDEDWQFFGKKKEKTQS